MIAVSPARKVTRFMRDCGFADFCVEMPQLTPEVLPRLVQRIVVNPLEFRRKLAEIAQTSRARLDQAYDELAACCRRPRRPCRPETSHRFPVSNFQGIGKR